MERRQAAVSRIALLIWAALAGLVLVLILFAVSAMREAGRRRRLSRFLPRELVARLADDDGSLRAGRRQQAVIAFVDMRGSTALAERLDPQQLSAFLSAFRRRVMRMARLHNGVVDKFIGDGALVVFGLPEARADDAARAVAFARDLVEVIARWNLKGEHAAAVRIGVGLHCGEVFSGIIGEEARYEFTVLGDTVNVAAAWSRRPRPTACRSWPRRPSARGRLGESPVAGGQPRAPARRPEGADGAVFFRRPPARGRARTGPRNGAVGRPFGRRARSAPGGRP